MPRAPLSVLLIVAMAMWLASMLPNSDGAVPAHQALDGGPSGEASFRAIYKELVEINTTESSGDTLKAARAMEGRLLAGGLPKADVQVLSTAPRKGNLVVRFRGTGVQKPMLLAAHIDVVEARREDWELDPFVLQEVGGYFRGRGVLDNKAMAAIFVDMLIRMKREGWRPARDIILALTSDEELAASPHNGMRFLIERHRALVDAEFAINEGGSGVLRDGKPVRLNLQLAEKVYLSFRLEVKDAGGHSATPRRENAIYRLAEGLVRLSKLEFPPRLNAVTSAYFARAATLEPPEVQAAIKALEAGNIRPEALAKLSARPNYNALVRTTCVATMLEAGHAENALPQSARATVNCRLLPDERADAVEAAVKNALADERIKVSPLGMTVESPASPLSPAVLESVEQISALMWPGVPVIPTQSSGYTDSRWLRRAGIPTYGISGIFSEEGKSGVHGLNEQVGVSELLAGREFLDRLVRRLAGPTSQITP